MNYEGKAASAKPSSLKVPFRVFTWYPEEEVGMDYSGSLFLPREIWLPWVT